MQGEEDLTIADNEPIIFNTVLTNTSPDLSYDDTTGEVTITRSGLYYINWWIAADGSTIEPTITYAIISSIGDNIQASSPILSCQLSGNALLNITSTPVTFKLVNVTGNDTFIGYTLVQADLTIIHLVQSFL